MKINNFKLVHISGAGYSDYIYYALVDVTTGFWFWKKTQTIEVARAFAGGWYFTDTGEFLGNYKVNELERAFCAKHRVNYLHEIKGG